MRNECEMRVLIGCECSGVVRDAFSARGHEAWSCDLKPSESGEGNHIQGDVVEAIMSQEWDFIGLHPDCTALAASGNAHYAEGKPGWSKRLTAATWTRELWLLACAFSPRVYLENPVGVLRALGGFGPSDQVIHPHQFGHDASKATCLWLRGLPELEPTNLFPPRVVNGKPRWGNQTDSGQNILGPSEARKTNRSRTYAGIAEAMADQWGAGA